MINASMKALGEEPSAIREIFMYGLKRKAAIGEDKVFDFSIGNPNVPTPVEVTEELVSLLGGDPVALHGYTPGAGAPSVRQAVADQISRDFGINATAGNIYMTAGAAAALAISIAAVTVPGDEVIVPTPYFPEYRTWVTNSQCALVEVPTTRPDFQLDIEAIAAAITSKTSAIIINSPNNPVGSVYGREGLEALAALLKQKEQELGRQIYIISDEPYRLLTYGAEVPYVPCIYPRTIVCYSYSKCFSLPGERIGYIYVSDLMDNAKETTLAVNGAGRALGFVCAPAIFQYMLEKCLDLPCEVETYAKNRAILTEGLSKLGYEYVEPQGAFYLWVRALEDDAEAFCARAREHELLLVPSNSFGATGWVRISYCVSAKTIEGSLPAFAALAEDYR